MLRETNVPIIQESVGKIYELSSDEQIREYVRQREKARLDWNSGMYNAEMRGRAEGREERDKELAEKWRRKGYTEGQIKELFAE